VVLLSCALAYHTPLRYWYSYRERHPYGVKNESLRKWIAREMSEKTTSIAGASNLPMTAVYEAKQLIRHVRGTISSVTAPALVVHAKEDDVASLKAPSLYSKTSERTMWISCCCVTVTIS